MVNSKNGLSVKVVLVDGEENVIEIDDGNIGTIEVEHHEIHKGNAFKMFTQFNINAVGTLYFQLKTGAKTLHFKDRHIVDGTNEIQYDIYEGATCTDGTVEIVPYNAKRSSTNISTAKIYSNPTNVVLTGALNIDREQIPGGGPQMSKIPYTQSIEWNYKPNTNYIIRVQNLTNASTTIFARYFWYEE